MLLIRPHELNNSVNILYNYNSQAGESTFKIDQMKVDSRVCNLGGLMDYIEFLVGWARLRIFYGLKWTSRFYGIILFFRVSLAPLSIVSIVWLCPWVLLTNGFGLHRGRGKQPRQMAVITTATSLKTITVAKAVVGLSSLRAKSSRFFLQQQCRRKPDGSRMLQIRAARTEAKVVSIGFRAPPFELPEPLTGRIWKLEDFESYPALLVMFICNHCPFVIHLKKDIVKLTNFYMKKKGLAVVAISSNSTATHPQDGPEFMAEDAKQFKYPFPYLYDESQAVARDFGAVCTPEFFLFKKDGRRPFELVYHGQFDDSRPRNGIPVTGRDLSQAIDCVLSGQPITSAQKPSIGCSIKWHPDMT